MGIILELAPAVFVLTVVLLLVAITSFWLRQSDLILYLCCNVRNLK